MDEQEFNELKKRVEDLEKYKEDRERQQITYPLDTQSFQILNKYFLTQSGSLWYTSAGGNLFKEVLVFQNGYTNALSARSNLIRYSVDVSTNIFTMGQDIINLSQGSFSNGQQVGVIASGDVPPGGDPPTPLTTAGSYYVVNANGAGTQFQLSLTFGGAAINITDKGTQEQYMYFIT